MLEEVFRRLFANKINLLLVLPLLFLVALRFLWIDKFPVGINPDETEVVLSAKTYWKFGTDTSSAPFPKSLFTNQTEAGLSGLPSILLTPILGWQKTSLASARIPFIIINLATLLFLVLLVWDLTKNRLLAYVVTAVGLINPWFFAYSRATTEAPFALFFVILGIYLLFKLRENKILFSVIPFVLSFYSYFGAKPLVPLLVPFLLFLHWKLGRRVKPSIYIGYLIGFFVLVGTYFIYLNNVEGNTFAQRTAKESIFSGLDRFSEKVNEERRASLEFPFKNLFYNKGALLTKEIAIKYLGWINPDFLFFGGDDPSVYRFGEHGVLYISDFLFLALGLVGLYKLSGRKEKILKYLTAGLLLLAPIPSAVSRVGESYYFRGFLLVPVLVLLVALGITTFIETLRRRRLFFVGCLKLLYSGLFIYFLAFFFFRYPVKQQENHFLSMRVLSNYLLRQQEDVTVITVAPQTAYNQYLFYSNALERGNSLIPPSNVYQIDGIFLTDSCEKFEPNIETVVDARLNCSVPKNDGVLIQDQKDAGFQFYLYNDELCKDDKLLPWRGEHLLSDYSLEEMSNSEFCQRWIQKWTP